MPRFMWASGRETVPRMASPTSSLRLKPISASSLRRCPNTSIFTRGSAVRWDFPPKKSKKVIDYALARIGKPYDSKQIVDLARYLFPYPPVPVWFRRRMLAIGAGNPTKAICSTLIAGAFQSIHYPILPERVTIDGKTYGVAPYVQSEIDHIRTHGLFTPRDFDVSPFFAIIKPTLAAGFDFHRVAWGPPAQVPAGVAPAAE